MLARPGRLGLLAMVILCVVLGVQVAAQAFPPLTGRVVDEAGILDAAARSALEAKLKAHEDKTSDQVVVATVRSLGGTSVEDYANRLYREWKLGTKDKNNGVLLLVAPNERKVRIEVGYGLEGALTDALSGVIIRTAIAPRFKAGDFAGGITAGVDGILSILSGDADEWQRRRKVRDDQPEQVDLGGALMFGFLILFVVWLLYVQNRSGGSRPYRRRNGTWIALPPSAGGSSWGGGSSWDGGSLGGGGFSGGGGSSGGGGASGSW